MTGQVTEYEIGLKMSKSFSKTTCLQIGDQHLGCPYRLDGFHQLLSKAFTSHRSERTDLFLSLDSPDAICNLSAFACGPGLIFGATSLFEA